MEEVELQLVDPLKNLDEVWAKTWYVMHATIFNGVPDEAVTMLDGKVQEFIQIGQEMVFSHINAIHEKYDLLLTATDQRTAFEADIFGPTEIAGQAIATFIGWAMIPMINQTGHPAANIPVGFDSQGLPFGLQVIGKRLDAASIDREARVF